MSDDTQQEITKKQDVISVEGKNGGRLYPWKPGQSGNPAGRPKKERAIATIMSTYDNNIVVQKLWESVLAGDIYAIRFWIEHQESKPIAEFEHRMGLIDDGDPFLELLRDAEPETKADTESERGTTETQKP